MNERCNITISIPFEDSIKAFSVYDQLRRKHKLYKQEDPEEEKGLFLGSKDSPIFDFVVSANDRLDDVNIKGYVKGMLSPLAFLDICKYIVKPGLHPVVAKYRSDELCAYGQYFWNGLLLENTFVDLLDWPKDNTDLDDKLDALYHDKPFTESYTYEELVEKKNKEQESTAKLLDEAAKKKKK